jgi:predicted nucleic acid-binding Zn finger protein
MQASARAERAESFYQPCRPALRFRFRANVGQEEKRVETRVFESIATREWEALYHFLKSLQGILQRGFCPCESAIFSRTRFTWGGFCAMLNALAESISAPAKNSGNEDFGEDR